MVPQCPDDGSPIDINRPITLGIIRRFYHGDDQLSQDVVAEIADRENRRLKTLFDRLDKAFQEDNSDLAKQGFKPLHRITLAHLQQVLDEREEKRLDERQGEHQQEAPDIRK